MTEKVLGYLKKDIEEMIKDWKFEAYATFPSEPPQYFLKTVVATHNLKDLFEKKQVPVVSVEKIEEVIKDISNAIEFVSKQSDTTVSYSAGQRCVLLAFKDCLKEAVEEKE